MQSTILDSQGDNQIPTQTMEMGPADSPGCAPRPGVFAPGEMLADRFRVVRFLGQGGMGQVFEAFDIELGARVALKAIHPDHSHNPAAAQRFKREVHLARQVTHGNVCRIFDLFLHRRDNVWGRTGRPMLFLTMELLAGESLSHELKRRGPVSLVEALPLIGDMAAALDAAHRVGIVHRDFKSANVMLVSGGHRPQAVVTDFGLAHTPHDLESGSGGPRGGTPGYMAPELRKKVPITPAADIYAFGVVVHELLTGRRPEAPSDEHPTLPAGSAAGAAEETSSHTEAPAWRAVVDRCLDPEPQNRFQSAGEVHDALAQVARAERRLLRRLLRPVGLAVAAVLTLVAASFSRQHLELAAIGHDDIPLASVQPVPDLSAASDAQRSSEFYAQGIEQLRRFDGVAARDLLRQAVHADRDAIKARSALAGALLLLASDSQAREVAWEAWELADGLTETDHMEVEARYRTTVREYRAAGELYRRLMTKFPDRLDFGLELAWIQFSSGQNDQVDETFASLRESLPLFEAEDPIAAARIDLLEARCALRLSQLDRALALATRATEFGRTVGSPEVVGQGLWHMGDALWRQGSLDQANETAREAQRILMRLKNQSGIAEVLRIRGNVALSRREVETGTHFYQKMIEISRKAGYDRGVFAGLHNLGLVHAEQGRLDKSQRTFIHFLNHARRRGVGRVQMIALVNLTAVSRRLGQLEAAEAYAAEGYKAAEFGRPEAVATLDHVVAEILNDRGDLQGSRRLLEQSRRQLLDLGADLKAVWAQASLADNFLLRGELEAARETYEKAGAVIRATDVDDTYIRRGLARLALAEGRAEQAAGIARQAVREFKPGGSLSQKAAMLTLLARAELERGALDGAQQALDQAEPLVGPHSELCVRSELAILSVRLAAAHDPRAAAAKAQKDLAQTLSSDVVELRLEARLALGQIEIAAELTGPDQGAQRLRSLARDAEHLGFLELSRRASRLADRSSRESAVATRDHRA